MIDPPMLDCWMVLTAKNEQFGGIGPRGSTWTHAMDQNHVKLNNVQTFQSFGLETLPIISTTTCV